MTVEFKPVSLLERIKNAETVEELSILSKEGFVYEHAASKTRGKWSKASCIRKAQLLKGNSDTEPKPKPRGKRDTKGKR